MPEAQSLGIKRLDISNWTALDPTNCVFGWVPQPKGILEIILTRRLTPQVPGEVIQLFEVARGAMIYGYFFYPLWTLATEQLYRVVETAVTARCEALGYRGRPIFNERLKFLEKSGQTAHGVNWHWIRHRRNEASHPAQQSIMNSAMAIEIVHRTADVIDGLFIDTKPPELSA